MNYRIWHQQSEKQQSEKNGKGNSTWGHSLCSGKVFSWASETMKMDTARLSQQFSKCFKIFRILYILLHSILRFPSWNLTPRTLLDHDNRYNHIPSCFMVSARGARGPEQPKHETQWASLQKGVNMTKKRNCCIINTNNALDTQGQVPRHLVICWPFGGIGSRVTSSMFKPKFQGC
jgi:hypothetical protein